MFLKGRKKERNVFKRKKERKKERIDEEEKVEEGLKKIYKAVLPFTSS